MVVQAASACQVCRSPTLLLLLLPYLLCCSSAQALTMEVFCFCLQLVCCLAACCLCVGNCRRQAENEAEPSVELIPVACCYPAAQTMPQLTLLYGLYTHSCTTRLHTEHTRRYEAA